MAIRF